MSNTFDFQNILFWLSFVAFIIFIVRGVHSSVLLKIQKTKDYPQSEFFITALTATFAILFTVISLSNHREINNNNQSIPSNTTIELHQEIGKVILYDSTDNTPDTLKLFMEKK